MAGEPFDLKDFIRNVPDFPQPGVLFRDITPLLLDPDAYRYAIDTLTREIEALSPDAIVGIEARGFLVGAPVAYNLRLPFVPVRKAGKLPADRASIAYELEYGDAQLDIHIDALEKGGRAVVVDDLLATGGTAKAAAQLIERLGASVAGFAFIVELDFLNGRNQIGLAPAFALLHYKTAYDNS